MEKLEIKTPAKINIGLNVIEKRPDGYHNIETIFYPINLFDKLTLYKSDSLKFNCKNNLIREDESNSIIHAIKLLEEESNGKINCLIELEKNIPIGAGMGGGSSDGAAALKAVNELFNLGVSDNRLADLALKIGSDVPFFLKAKSCFAQSRGELMRDLRLKIPLPILVVNPGIHISTRWAYENINPVKPKKSLFEKFNNPINDFKYLKDLVNNDFEDVVFKKFPEIKEIKETLYSNGALFALMTGSGSTVFAIFDGLNNALKAKEKFSGKCFTFIHQE